MEPFAMAKKLKHSKIKNTGILFELLTRQITADVLDGKDSKAVTIVKNTLTRTLCWVKSYSYTDSYLKNTTILKIKRMSCWI